jgi:hypothetical protein
MTRSDCRVISLLLLCTAVLLNSGNFSTIALTCMLLSVAFSVNSFSEPPRGPTLPRWVGLTLMLGLAGSTALYDRKLDHHVFLVLAAVIAAAVLLFSVVRARAVRAAAFVVAALAVACEVALSVTWGRGNIDVFSLQQVASQALLNGHNPYSPVVPSVMEVAPGVAAYLQLHFAYGPILPVLEAPFRLLGDVRILHILAALVTSGAVLALARRAGTLDRAACLVMAFPLTAGMVVASWVDIISMAFLAVWLVSFRTHSTLAIVALALALGAKPTTLIALVPILFWSVPARRQMVIAVAAEALFILPFALITGVSRFYYDVFGVYVVTFPRLDALTINSALNSFTLPTLPFAVSAGLVAATTILVLRRRPATYGDLLTGTAILATVSFLVAKWAYFNYYYIPAVLLMLAIAGTGLPFDVPEMIRPPALLVRSSAWLMGWLGHPRGGAVPGIARTEAAPSLSIPGRR